MVQAGLRSERGIRVLDVAKRLLGPADEVHLVDREDDPADADQPDEAGVAARIEPLDGPGKAPG